LQLFCWYWVSWICIYRQLGGKALGLGFNKSIVKLSVFSEADIPSEDVYAHGICDIENGNERPFVVNTVCVARFHSLCLRNFKRTNPRGTSDELVTEQKYAFVFYTTFNICGKTFPVKVIIFIHFIRVSILWLLCFIIVLRNSPLYSSVIPFFICLRHMHEIFQITGVDSYYYPRFNAVIH